MGPTSWPESGHAHRPPHFGKWFGEAVQRKNDECEAERNWTIATYVARDPGLISPSAA